MLRRSSYFLAISLLLAHGCGPAPEGNDSDKGSSEAGENSEDEASSSKDGDDGEEGDEKSSASSEADSEDSDSDDSDSDDSDDAGSADESEASEVDTGSGDEANEADESAESDEDSGDASTETGSETESGEDTGEEEEASETFVPDGNECELPAWRDFHPAVDEPFALMVGPDAQGEKFDLCNLAGEAPVLVIFSNPGCIVCEQVAEYLSTDGNPTIPDPWVAEVTSNLNAKMAAGELNIVNFVFDLGDVSKTGLASDWQQRFPHANVHNLDIQPATGATLTEVIRMCPRGFPSFYYLNEDLSLHTMGDPDAQSKEAHWAAIIEANRAP